MRPEARLKRTTVLPDTAYSPSGPTATPVAPWQPSQLTWKVWRMARAARAGRKRSVGVGRDKIRLCCSDAAMPLTCRAEYPFRHGNDISRTRPLCAQIEPYL